VKGSEFARTCAALPLEEREARALDLVREGSFVQWPWKAVYSTEGPFSATIFVSSDYFAIGEEDDFLRLPMTPILAQKIADLFGWSLPTRKIVDLVWHQADLRLEPHPTPPDAGMRTLGRYAEHNATIQAEIEASPHASNRSALVAGHKKDLVLSNALVAGKVAIYGWHRATGIPIQGLNSSSHSSLYEDYSHGVRFVRGDVVVNEEVMKLLDVLRTAIVCGLVSDEGALRVLRQPGVPKDVAASDTKENRTMMKIGDKGSAIADWQGFLNERGFRDQEGRPLTADGDFGKRTEYATKRFQGLHGLQETGTVTAATLAMAAKDVTTAQTPIPPTVPAALDAIRFVQARNFTRLSVPRTVDLVVIHAMEAPEKPTTAENVAAWFAGPSSPMASAHYCVDEDSIVQTVREEDVAWHAPGANRNGIGIEHAGFAKQSVEDWADPFSLAMLARSARLVAGICKRWSIPVVRLRAEDLKANKRGICGHIDCTNAFANKKKHWDPGPNFPWDSYIAQIQEALAIL